MGKLFLRILSYILLVALTTSCCCFPCDQKKIPKEIPKKPTVPISKELPEELPKIEKAPPSDKITRRPSRDLDIKEENGLVVPFSELCLEPEYEEESSSTFNWGEISPWLLKD